MSIFAAVLFAILAMLFGAFLDASGVHTAYVYLWGFFAGMVATGIGAS